MVALRIQTGMLWVDADPECPFDEKVFKATCYYANKHKQEATICYVHPVMLKDLPQTRHLIIGTVEILQSEQILPNHFWLGREETKDGQASSE